MKLNVYLMFDGNCLEAITFYEKVLSGKIEMTETYEKAKKHMKYKPEHADKIMHSKLTAGEVLIMASDNMSKDFKMGNNFSLSLEFGKDLKKATSVFRALSEEGSIIMPLEDTFWGGKFGMLTDKFGIQWMLSVD
jgi:PhnB protein